MTKQSENNINNMKEDYDERIKEFETYHEGEIAKKEYWDSHVDEFKSIYDTWFGGS